MSDAPKIVGIAYLAPLVGRTMQPGSIVTSDYCTAQAIKAAE